MASDTANKQRLDARLREQGEQAMGLRPRGRLDFSYVAPAVLAVLGFAAGFSHIWDFDIHFHILCGDWMIRNGKVMGHDYFSIDPQPQWINVQWLFQVLVAAIYKAGSWEALSYFKGLIPALTMLAFGLSLRRRVPTGWLIFCGMMGLMVMQSRLRTRPEIMTFLFLVLTLWICDSVRRGAGPRRMWWMVPIMIVWVNMHGIYFLGPCIMWGIIIGSLVDVLFCRPSAASRFPWPGGPPPLPGFVEGIWRRLTGLRAEAGEFRGNLLTPTALAAALGATIACFVSPWPIEAAFNFLTLWKRMADPVYVNGVTELARTWENFGSHRDAILLFVFTVGAMIANFRRLPLSHVAIFAAFTAMALMARRNVGIFAPVAAYLLALHCGQALRDVARWKPSLIRIGPAFTALMVAAALAISAAFFTGAAQRYLGSGSMPGPGQQPDNYSSSNARFLAELPLEGDMWCENFGDGSVYIFWANYGRNTPVRLSYMDGRLEAHSLQRFVEVRDLRRYLLRAEHANDPAICKIPPSVRFVLVRFDATNSLTAFMEPLIKHGPGEQVVRYHRYRLLHFDPAGACFARLDWNGGAPGATDHGDLPMPSFADYDLPLGRDGRIADSPLAIERTWYRQNPPALEYQLGAELLALGQQYSDADADSATPLQSKCIRLAIRYLGSADAAGQGSRSTITSALAQAYHQAAWQDFAAASRMPVDVDTARAMFLYRKVDLGALNSDGRKNCSLQRLVATVNIAGDLMEAWSLAPSMAGYQDSGDSGTWAKYVKLRDGIAPRIKAARKAATDDGVYELPTVPQAAMLGSVKYGLVGEATKLLEDDVNLDWRGQMLLGDLLLRQGKPDEARTHYKKAAEGPVLDEDRWQLDMRLAVCDWVEGEQFKALDVLEKLDDPERPQVGAYLMKLRQEIGIEKIQ